MSFMDLLTEEILSAIQTDIEARLADAEPEVEVVLAEVVSGATLRLYIDHPDGVTLGLCERVSGQLNDYRDRYSLEVSSPGADRPLTKPEHFRRFVGRKVRVRTRAPSYTDAAGTPTDRKHVTGELVAASEGEITIAAESGMVTIPHNQILRCNLVPGD
jgi:ribosome maturation factor RimP